MRLLYGMLGGGLITDSIRTGIDGAISNCPDVAKPGNAQVAIRDDVAPLILRKWKICIEAVWSDPSAPDYVAFVIARKRREVPAAVLLRPDVGKYSMHIGRTKTTAEPWVCSDGLRNKRLGTFNGSSQFLPARETRRDRRG